MSWGAEQMTSPLKREDRSPRRRRPRTRLAGLVAVTLLLGPVVSTARAQVPDPDDLTDPEDLFFTVIETLGAVVPDNLQDPLDQLDPLNPACNPLDPAMCMYPFPSNEYTVPADTPTGLKVELPLLGMPRNIAGKPIDPTEWNRNDGFSPGSMLLTHVPNLDLVATWGLGDRPERYQDQVTDLALSVEDDSPIVIVDADTGERHPFFAELDGHPADNVVERTLIIRPAVNFLEGHRYVVGLRNLVDTTGDAIPARSSFAALRDGAGPSAEQARYDADIFPALAGAGVARDELFLAWDFTIASADNLAGRVLSMRDSAFAELGDTDLADGVVQGDAPTTAVTEVEPDGDEGSRDLRTVRGTVTVPNYLTLPRDLPVEVPELGGVQPPLQRLVYAEPLPGPNAKPIVNPLDPTIEVPWTCVVPRTALDTPATPALYGHGLLGGQGEAEGSSTALLRDTNYMPCAVDWAGMSTPDIVNVALILTDVSWFPSLADEVQQGFLNFLFLGRALAHPEGLISEAAFHGPDEQPLFDPDRLVYDGNSQGGIMGGALTALAPDLTRSVLGVPATNYSTLLNRSVDWEGKYGEAAYVFYTDHMEQQLLFALIQMVWDRAEGNGFAQHMTDDPYPNTPPHQVLLHVAFGDHQVSNLAAEVEGRTIGADRVRTDLPVCRHWATDMMFGFDPVDESSHSALVYFDSGTPRSPNDNNPPEGFGEDPHSDPRKDTLGMVQKDVFYQTGQIIDPFAGAYYQTAQWPTRAGDQLDTVLSEAQRRCKVPKFSSGGPPPGKPRG